MLDGTRGEGPTFGESARRASLRQAGEIERSVHSEDGARGRRAARRSGCSGCRRGTTVTRSRAYVRRWISFIQSQGRESVWLKVAAQRAERCRTSVGARGKSWRAGPAVSNERAVAPLAELIAPSRGDRRARGSRAALLVAAVAERGRRATRADAHPGWWFATDHRREGVDRGRTAVQHVPRRALPDLRGGRVFRAEGTLGRAAVKRSEIEGGERSRLLRRRFEVDLPSASLTAPPRRGRTPSLEFRSARAERMKSFLVRRLTSSARFRRYRRSSHAARARRPCLLTSTRHGAK